MSYSGFYSENYDSGAPPIEEAPEVEYYDLSTLDIELEKIWADAPVIDEPAQITTQVYQFTFNAEAA
jgi:hypothetical protein